MDRAAIIHDCSFEFKKRFRDTRKYPREFQSHDLVKLARKAELKFTIEEEDLLRRLTRSAIWYGRYPVPLNYNESAGAETFSDGKEYSISWFGEDDVDRLNRFIEGLEVRLRIRS